MAQVKYIAKGFMADASKLLDEFYERNCLEFSVFAEVWKKHHFSFIYKGRESVMELNQFTQEIFKRTTMFLLSSSFKMQVGAAFLLYALYRNQIIEPLVPIRVELPVFRTLKSIRDKAVGEKLISLHYVLNYLFDNAFILVAFNTLKGPTVRSATKRFDPQPIGGCRVLFESGLEEFKKSELLEDLLATFSLYGEDSNSDQWLVASEKVKEFVNSSQQHTRSFGTLVSGDSTIAEEVGNESAVAAEASSESAVAASGEDTTEASCEPGVGSRQTGLKTIQFFRTAKDPGLSIEARCSVAPELAKKVRVFKPRCTRKSKRDQKRRPSDDDSDECLTELFNSKLPKPSARPRHEKAHRVRRYYKEKPSKGCRRFVDDVYLADYENE